MIPDPERAVADMGRCVKPGGELVGTAFLADGGLRQRMMFGIGSRTGHVAPTASAADLERWLGQAGFEAVDVQPRRGFAHFRGRKRAGQRA
jgi:hypothetical protein